MMKNSDSGREKKGSGVNGNVDLPTLRYEANAPLELALTTAQKILPTKGVLHVKKSSVEAMFTQHAKT